MNKIFTEIGIGNETFINTEVEFIDGKEERYPGFKKMKIKGIYFRFWLGGYNAYVFSTVNGFSKTIKNRKEFKILFGIKGIAK